MVKKHSPKDTALFNIAFSLVAFLGFVTMGAVGVYYSGEACAKNIGVIFKVLIALDCWAMAVTLSRIIVYGYYTQQQEKGMEPFLKFYDRTKIVNGLTALARLAIVIWLMVETFSVTTATCGTIEWNVALSYSVIFLALAFLEFCFTYLSGIVSKVMGDDFVALPAVDPIRQV